MGTNVKKRLQELHAAYRLMRTADKVRFHANPSDGGARDTDLIVFENKSRRVGMMTYAAMVASFCAYAEKRGLLLIVDLKTHPCVNLDADRVGIDNAWEYYYEQPFPEAPSLDEAYRSRSYYLTPEYRKELLGFYPGIHRSLYYRLFYNKKTDFPTISIESCLDDPAEYAFWCGICQRYLRLNDETKAYIAAEYDTLMRERRVLGISLRGTDYTRKKTYAHPIQPEVEEVLAKAEEYCAAYGYEYLYVSCEEYAVVRKFEERFPGRILINKRQFFDHVDFAASSTMIGDVSFDRENDAYLRGLEYISSIYLLSQCSALIAGQNTGSQMAYVLNNGAYEQVFFYRLGKYGISD